MCGIVGVASTQVVTERRWLAEGRDRMCHRGPDDVGEWWAADGRAGLGQRRLAIIDLTPAGHQPMPDAEGRICVVLNGEIYNYKDLRRELIARGHSFASESDTEVLLAAYKEWNMECLPKLCGMFAFAIYDASRRHLFVARDRCGEKPLFYRLSGGMITFASELKALMSDETLSRRVSRESLDCLLAEGFVAGERCILEGVRKLPPAHALLFHVETGAVRVWRYWHLPHAPSDTLPSETSEGELLDELESVLQGAVRRQLAADVPVGVLLSGGVDSSLVTALAARATHHLKTFTVRFPGYGVYDETEHARLIASHFGTEHVELEADATNIGLLPLLARQFDEPMIDSSMIPTYLLSRLVRGYCTVALGGDGGDELFGGYPHYNRLVWMQAHASRIPLPVRRAVGWTAGKLLPVGVKGRNWARALGADDAAGVPPVRQLFDSTIRKRILARNARSPMVAECIRNSRIPRHDDLLQRSTRLDFENYLAEDILVKVDRASMLASLEVRAPMLDVAVVEFAFGKVPSSLKATSQRRKILLKKLAGRLLPREFDKHRKQGFSIPLPSWLKAGPWREYFREVLLDPSQLWFDHRAVEGLLTGEGTWRSNSEGLFGLVMCELWRREYRVEIVAAQ